MKQHVSTLLREKFGREVVLEKPKDRSFGHFATPIAFSLAKELRKSPMIIAEELASSFSDDNSVFASVESVKGYLNFRLSESFLNEYASWALDNSSKFAKQEKKTKILLEFVSANPTGPLHIGHARGAVYGDTLYRLAKHLGYEITAEYYVNDAGRQIVLLGLSVYLAAREILGFDVEWPDEYYRGEYIKDLAKELKASRLEELDENDNSLFYHSLKDKLISYIQILHINFLKIKMYCFKWIKKEPILVLCLIRY